MRGFCLPLDPAFWNGYSISGPAMLPIFVIEMGKTMLAGVRAIECLAGYGLPLKEACQLTTGGNAVLKHLTKVMAAVWHLQQASSQPFPA